MTEPDPIPAEHLTELIAGVQTLTRAVTESHANMESLTASNERLVGSSKRHRRWIAVSIFGLAVDLALSVLFIYQHAKQNELNDRLNCQNGNLALRQDYATRSFNAEYTKVAGQIDGLKKIRTATSQPAALLGFDEFIGASQHYLDVIAAIQKDRLAHPLTGC